MPDTSYEMLCMWTVAIVQANKDGCGEKTLQQYWCLRGCTHTHVYWYSICNVPYHALLICKE